ncbi:hypothetical protein SSS_06578 [Sarcoptes scabiei]|uniref:Uncharacterized protein n=1 Tax=Sarcoptes scabiei TaxID=52283 RepID=A0A834VEP7_SARSC|nr:hypothetical protein SSS_06578 [Sarcoptes scabiei]
MPLSQIVLHQIGALIVLFFSSMIIAFCPLLILRWFHKRKKRRLRNRWNHQASISKSSSSSSTSSTTFSSSSSSSSAYSSSSSSPSSPSTSYNTKMSINSMALHSTLYVPNILLGQLQSLQSGLLIATMFLIFLPQLRYSVDILMNSYYYRSSIGSTAIHRSTQLDQHPNPHPTSTPHLNFLEQISSPERFVQESHHNVNGSSTISQRLIQTIFRNNFEPIPIVEVIVCLAFFLLYFLEEFLQITFRYRQYFWACNSSIVLSSSDGSCTFTSLDYRINCTKQFLIDCSRRTFSNRSEESNSTGASNLSLIREKNNDSGQEINLAPKTMTKATKIVSTFESDIKNDVIVNNDDDDRDQNNGSNLIDSTINQNETHRTNPIHSDNLVERVAIILTKPIIEYNLHHQTNKYREHRTEKQQPDDKEECQIETMIGDDDDDYSHCNHDYYHDHHLNDIRNSKTFEPQSLLSNSSVNLPSYYWQSNSMPKYDQYHHYPCHHHHHHHHHHRQQQQQQQQCLKSDQPDSIFAINLDDDNDHHHDGVEDLNGETKLKIFVVIKDMLPL